MTSTNYKNRSVALAHFTEDEKAVIERYNALLRQIAYTTSLQKRLEKNKVYNHPHVLNYHYALAQGLFEKEGIDPKTIPYYRKIRKATELVEKYAPSASSHELLSPSPPSVLDDPSLGDPIST